MAAISLTGGANGPRSMSGTFPLSNGTDTISNAQILAACAPGPLRDLLADTYATLADFMTALAAKGGIVAITTGTTTLTSYVWVVSASTPSLSVVAGAAGTACIRVSLAHSITE